MKINNEELAEILNRNPELSVMGDLASAANAFPPRRNKHNNRKIYYNGHTLDSQLEADRYFELLLLEESGQISSLEVHPTYELQPGFRDKRGKRHIRVTIKLDFRYLKDGRIYVEDTKGQRTAMFNLKIKWFLYQYDDLVEFRMPTRKDVGRYFKNGRLATTR